MPSPRPPRAPGRLLLSLPLLACVWHRAACAPGDGMRIWTQPKPDPSTKDQAFLHGSFPSGFLWGTGTSAFQTEGSWNADGKGPSVWDHFVRSSGAFPEGADVAGDSYARGADDVEALEYLGVSSYSFSLSWPRLFPDGDPRGRANAAAVEHYGRLIDRLRARSVEPVVTLHHWDLPQALQERYGGWRNQTLVEMFEEYAAFCFRAFGGRVRYWLTMHNPYLVAAQGYGTGAHAPGEAGGTAASLVVAHNLIRAHARAWHAYDTGFRAAQRGQVSIVLGSHWVEPQTDRAPDVELCQESMDAILGWFAKPIFVDGDYPLSLKNQHGPLLPAFSSEERLWVRGTADFFALSFGPNILRLGRALVQHGQTVTPDLRRLLGWIKNEYEHPRVLVAEAGWFSDAGVGREDTVAIYLMKRFINQVLQAVRVDGVDVFGYTAWSLVDGFEWNKGYAIRRGLFYVDFSGPNRSRTPKTSAQYYRQVIAHNGFPRDEGSAEVEGRFPCDFHWGIADSTLQVRLYPFSPQFTDRHLYLWNRNGTLRSVSGVLMPTRRPQCTDFLSIRDHLALLARTGASHYRFALNWSLILPQGDLSTVNAKALRYYGCVLTELKRLEVEAVVVLYYPTHRGPNLGLPEPLHASGGWLNDTTVEAFLAYAALCYEQLGPWVSHWITVNEPNRLVDVYAGGAEAHRAAHNLLLAHAKAWRLYEREHLGKWRAPVSLALHADWAEPANPYLESHAQAAQRFLLFELGRFLDPLLAATPRDGPREGDYPAEMKTYLEERAQVMGLSESPLPTFTQSEKEEVAGALSFIALNHFTTRLVSPAPPSTAGSPQEQPSACGCQTLADPTWPSSGLGQAVVPQGLRKTLNWIHQRYGGAVPIVITASGVDDQAPVDDRLRQNFLRTYLQEALKARQSDGVNVQGFYVWKLQDRNVPQFGLFTSTHHQSRAKASLAVYREIIHRGGFPSHNTTQGCRAHQERESCLTCGWMFKYKLRLVIGGCLLITTAMLASLLISLIMTKRNQTMGRGRSIIRMSREKVPVCSCPPFKH